MKTNIKSLNDALSFLLQGLYSAEKALVEEFASCCSQVSSPKIKREIQVYTSSCSGKMLKIERIFNYLLKDTLSRQNDVITAMMNETHSMLNATSNSHLRDVMSVACVQNINAYKISSYRSAYLIAVELELDTVTDLIQQILEWELETRKSLSALSIEEFNKSQTAPKLKDNAWEID